MFTIENAPVQTLRDYAYYCEAKNDIEEIPLTFDQWQECNLAASTAFRDGHEPLDEREVDEWNNEFDALRHEFFD
jgi:hypothetical protein